MKVNAGGHNLQREEEGKKTNYDVYSQILITQSCNRDTKVLKYCAQCCHMDAHVLVQQLSTNIRMIERLIEISHRSVRKFCLLQHKYSMLFM